MMIPPYSSSQRQVRSTNASRPSSKRFVPSGRPLPLDHRVHRDRGVVVSRLPERVEASHPVPADEHVLGRGVERVAHVQVPGDVGLGSAIENVSSRVAARPPGRGPPSSQVRCQRLLDALRAGRADPWRGRLWGGSEEQGAPFCCRSTAARSARRPRTGGTASFEKSRVLASEGAGGGGPYRSLHSSGGRATARGHDRACRAHVVPRYDTATEERGRSHEADGAWSFCSVGGRPGRDARLGDGRARDRDGGLLLPAGTQVVGRGALVVWKNRDRARHNASLARSAGPTARGCSAPGRSAFAERRRHPLRGSAGTAPPPLHPRTRHTRHALRCRRRRRDRGVSAELSATAPSCLRRTGTRHERRLQAPLDRLAGHHALVDVAAGGQLEHHVEQRALDDRAQAAGARLAGERLFGDLPERVVGEDELDVS